MPYATRQDIDAINGSTDVDARLTMLPETAVEDALAKADALIDGYLKGRYVLPLNPVPPELAQKAAALARYTLLGDSITERARNDFKDTMAWLKDVSQGAVLLNAAVPAPGNEPSTVVMNSSSPSVFKRGIRP